MNKTKLVVVATLLNAATVFAGGILTNTNQNVHFLRNPARDASTEIDAVYSNPAGVSMLSEGFHFSINNQSAFQTRTIKSTSPIFSMSSPTGSDVRSFKGKASAPIIPSIQAVYRKGKWGLSGNIAIVGGGGKATFNEGLPSFEAVAGTSLTFINTAESLTKYKANRYDVDQHMKGSNFIYGAQLGGSYKINDMFSAYAGFRLNIVHNNYEGYLRNLKVNLTPTASTVYSPQLVSPQEIFKAIEASGVITDRDQQRVLDILTEASTEKGAKLDSKQDGWGVAPILGFNFNLDDKLNIGVKYEFKTSLDVENDTRTDDTGLYRNGVNTAHDVPALFTIGVSYKILPSLTASVGYHHFFDSNAKMADEKHKNAGSTNEYLFGMEYQIDPMFLVSAGGQITRYGVDDIFQRDLSFMCNSYSIGLGGAINVSPKVKINLGYFLTTYSDYAKEPGGGIDPKIATNKDVFARTNKVFGAGVDFSF